MIVCGRFTLRTPAAVWAQQLLPLWSDKKIESRQAQFHQEQASEGARYNIAPTQNVSCVLGGVDGVRRWEMFRWGLIPPWADDPAIGNRMINARCETAHEKRSFSAAFSQRRCLVPADGYFEWKKTADGKQPYLIERQDGGVLAMAGLWESNKKLASGDRPLESVTLLTTEANPATAAIHHRMPVFVEPDDQALWLDLQVTDPDQLKTVFTPTSDHALVVREVSRFVNSPRNDSPKCIAPAAPPDSGPQQADLF